MEEKQVVINACFGGFSLSAEAIRMYAKLKGFEVYLYRRSYENGGVRYERFTDTTENSRFVDFVAWYKKDFGDTPQEVDWSELFDDDRIARDDETLIKVVKKLRSKANGRYAKLKIVKIPSDIEFEIEEYDGVEWVAETHRTWR